MTPPEIQTPVSARKSLISRRSDEWLGVDRSMSGFGATADEHAQERFSVRDSCRHQP